MYARYHEVSVYTDLGRDMATNDNIFLYVINLSIVIWRRGKKSFTSDSESAIWRVSGTGLSKDKSMLLNHPSGPPRTCPSHAT